MLKNLRDLQGYALRATDGDVGTVKDFYFDDVSWTVRYLVVETGHWLASRKVLIAPASLGVPDPEDRVVPISITREQVRGSPDIDTDKPVSRQHELDYLDYYGYPAYWDSVGLWGAGGLPGMTLPETGMGAASAEERERLARAHDEVHRNDDPHLRSAHAVVGYHLKARDGEIGHVQGFLVDQESWAIRYLSVETSHWWSGHKVLLAPQWIHEVSWIDRQVVVGLTRNEIREAPAWDTATPPDRTQEIEIYRHYDRAGYW
ncbi:MAG: PRC-barrel domain-containing protein [Pseudomonadota bacterium]|nr:PRC-barrel domain-containing protein [Pseudomonadota bacterium]